MFNVFVFILSITSLFGSNDSLINDSLRPNIILINIDDMGWKDVGFMGSEYYETPHIDSMAKEGIIFTNAYAAASNCAPSRACLMSGQWSPRHGIYTVASSERGRSMDRKLIPVVNNETIPDDNILLPQLLKRDGYNTCHAGKWHLSNDPLKHGFDVNIGGNHAGHPFSYYAPFENVPLEGPDGYYLTNLIMDQILEFIKKAKSPFFLHYAPYAVHTPLHPVNELLPKYREKSSWGGQNNAKYATMIENLDDQIGRLILFLKESGQLNNTFILFTSDNGGHYGVTKQLPLRSGKGSYYEGGIRVPMFVYWPGNVGGGKVIKTPVSNLDFYPTLLEVAKINQPPDKLLDGISIMPILLKEAFEEDRPLFWHFPIYLEAYQKEGDPTQDPLFRTRPGSAIRLGNWKLIHYFEYDEIELYNLKEDIQEQENIVKLNPGKAGELLHILDQWRLDVNAFIPRELNPEYIEN